MGSGKSHRPGNSLRSTSKRKRRAACKSARLARWKKPKVPGARVMDLKYLSKGFEAISKHNPECQGKCSLTREVERQGLASVLEVGCDSCEFTCRFESCPKIDGSKEINQRYSVNVGAVWGQMSIGGGHKPLNELLATMNVPGISKKSFLTIESQIGASWEKILGEEMVKAGKEEKKLALERKDIVNGYPAITVIVDGGWSKRSHKHSYNAKAGVAIIIGKETQKLLYMGVRNKFCSICTVASNKGVSPKKHTCFKNWSGSSCSMETVCGFNAAEAMHGIRYMRVIGDGDSSVMCDIHQYVPVWGHMVTKIECANHAIKCYTNRLQKIIQDFPNYKGKGKLTQPAIKRLTAGARCAIKMHTDSNNIDLLRADLRNGPSHVFNDHSKCSPLFCKVAAKVAQSNPSTSASSTEGSSVQSASDIENVVQEEEDETRGDDTSDSTEDSSLQSTFDGIITLEVDDENIMNVEEDEAREGGDNSVSRNNLPDDLFFRIQRAGDRLVSMAPQLISNKTTNLAECYMNVRCKFDGGKFYNRIQRGSFQHRCYGAGIRFQMGPDWSSQIWSRATGTKPAQITVEHGEKEKRDHRKSADRKSQQAYKEQRKRTKYVGDRYVHRPGAPHKSP